MFGWLSKPGLPAIRRIGPEFGKACAGIHAKSFAHPWGASEFESLLAGRDVIAQAAFLVAASGKGSKEPSGFVLSRCAADTAEILTIAVAPASRRQGMGGALLASHLAALAAEGVKSLFLEVEAENQAALTLYRRLDFHQVGERKAYYRKEDGNRAAALVLRRELY